MLSQIIPSNIKSVFVISGDPLMKNSEVFQELPSFVIRNCYKSGKFSSCLQFLVLF
jgi:hypothetical protein